MTSIIRITWVTLALCGLANAAVLTDGIRISRIADDVNISKINDVRVTHEKYEPKTSNSVAQISGLLEITAEVEGNICTNVPASLEFQSYWIYNAYTHRVTVTASRPYEPFPAIPVGCSAFSAPRRVVIPIKLQSYIFDGVQVHDEKYILPIEHMGSDEYKEITITDRKSTRLNSSH